MMVLCRTLSYLEKFKATAAHVEDVFSPYTD